MSLHEREEKCVWEKKTVTTWDLSSLSCGGEYINNKIKSSKTAQNSPRSCTDKIHTESIMCFTVFKVLQVAERQTDNVHTNKARWWDRKSVFRLTKSSLFYTCCSSNKSNRIIVKGVDVFLYAPDVLLLLWQPIIWWWLQGAICKVSRERCTK